MENVSIEDNEKAKLLKREAKVKKFREYLVDKGVVLAVIKSIIKYFNNILYHLVLLSLKQSDDRPKKPINAIRDFFGHYKDKSWENHEIIREEIFLLKQQTPKLQEKVNALEEKLAIEKNKIRVKKIYEQFEPDKNVITFDITFKGIYRNQTNHRKTIRK